MVLHCDVCINEMTTKSCLCRGTFFSRHPTYTSAMLQLLFFRRIVVRLVSMAGTGHFYTTTRNKQKPPLEFLKHDPVGEYLKKLSKIYAKKYFFKILQI